MYSSSSNEKSDEAGVDRNAVPCHWLLLRLLSYCLLLCYLSVAVMYTHMFTVINTRQKSTD